MLIYATYKRASAAIVEPSQVPTFTGVACVYV